MSGRKASSPNLKFGSGVQNSPGPGKKSLPDPTSVKLIFLLIVQMACEKVLFIRIEVKLTLYSCVLFVVSVIADYLPPPKTFHAHRSNILNTVFVKWGWAWTIASLSLFLMLTSYVYCCRNAVKIRQHFIRLIIATCLWYFWTSSFGFIDYYTGICVNAEMFSSKSTCIQNGYKWLGFDISGHTFILIFCNLLIYEEAKAILGWEGIDNMIRNEEYSRKGEDYDTPLKYLTTPELAILKVDYCKFTPYIRFAFIWLTMLSALWDLMLIITVLYYHTMIQKVLGSLIAILSWYATYRVLYMKKPLPGDGKFKYGTKKAAERTNRMSYYHQKSEGKPTTFMGFPINSPINNVKATLSTENNVNE